MKNNLPNLYDRLAPHERFKMVLEAEARDDQRECSRLAETCPLVDYRIQDPACMDLINHSRSVVLVFCAAWQGHMRDYDGFVWTFRMVDKMKEFRNAGFIEGANHGWERAGKTTPLFDPAERDRHRDPDHSDTLKHVSCESLKQYEEVATSVSRLLGLYEGLRKFCVEIGIDPELLINSWCPAQWPEVQEIIERFGSSDLPLDTDVANAAEKCFKSYIPVI